MRVLPETVEKAAGEVISQVAWFGTSHTTEHTLDSPVTLSIAVTWKMTDSSSVRMSALVSHSQVCGPLGAGMKVGLPNTEPPPQSVAPSKEAPLLVEYARSYKSVLFAGLVPVKLTRTKFTTEEPAAGAVTVQVGALSTSTTVVQAPVRPLTVSVTVARSTVDGAAPGMSWSESQSQVRPAPGTKGAVGLPTRPPVPASVACDQVRPAFVETSSVVVSWLLDGLVASKSMVVTPPTAAPPAGALIEQVGEFSAAGPLSTSTMTEQVDWPPPKTASSMVTVSSTRPLVTSVAEAHSQVSAPGVAPSTGLPARVPPPQSVACAPLNVNDRSRPLGDGCVVVKAMRVLPETVEKAAGEVISQVAWFGTSHTTDGLGEVVLGSDRLQRRVGKPLGQQDDRGRVAGERRRGEGVDLIERELHASLSRSATFSMCAVCGNMSTG